MTPIPPSRATAIAIFVSVTVSIAAEIIGVFSVMFRENFVLKSTSRGRTSEYAGTNNKSSKVNPSVVILSAINDIGVVFLGFYCVQMYSFLCKYEIH